MDAALVAAPLALSGALVAALVAWVGNRRGEQRAQRDRVVQVLRWGAELAVEPDGRRADVGVAVLGVLVRALAGRSIEDRLVEAVASASSIRPAAA